MQSQVNQRPVAGSRRASPPRQNRSGPIKKEKPVRLFAPKAGPVSGGFVANLLVLLLLGLIMLFSASYATAFFKFGDSYYYIRPQIGYAVIGLIVTYIASRVDYRWIRRFTWTLYLATLILLVAVLFMEPINGHRRWINLPGIPTIQVSEIAKFSIILCLAHLFDKYPKRVKEFRFGVIVPALLLVPILVLLSQETHYSAMILVCCIAAAVMWCGGTRLLWFLLGIGGAGGIGTLFLVTRMDHVQERLQGWFDPFADMLDSTMQTGQSLYTIGSGGLFGVGIGNSIQKHLWLPEAQNDFIFAVLCEELGFVGAMVCVFLFALLVVQGVLIAVRAPDRFGALLVIGTVAQIGFQFLLNVAVVTNLVPNTGISLPFFSSGGSSLLLLLGQIGIVLSVSRAGNKKRMLEQQADEEERRLQRQREMEMRQNGGDDYARFEQ